MIHHNTIIHADCLTALPQLPSESVDFILTDPPYVHRTAHMMAASFPMTVSNG
jgi:DNA modification methylase